jgi:putative tricarboxylic transport membrane protein
MFHLQFLLDIFTPLNFIIALAGVCAGIVIGAMPGLTATMAVAVLVPFTFAAPPATALIALGAIYTGAIYGGSYAAPGHPQPLPPPSMVTRWPKKVMAI